MPRRSVCMKPDFEPRATEYMQAKCWRSSRCSKKRVWRTSRPTGDVNYSVRDFPGYGKLSGKSLDDLRAGERVEIDAGEARSARFRAVEACQAGRAGVGPARGARAARAGISSARRCRARCSGEHFDIHGGGRTCSFRTTRTRSRSPRARTASTFVNYWMHNGFVRVDDEKMSKSLGNFFTVREVLASYDAGGRALLHPARALPQPAQLFRPASRRRARRR